MPALPSGTIVMWAGSIASIPGGFVLCDGTLGTPDLRGRFIVVAGSTYAVGATGGSPTHSHDVTGSGHTHTLGSGPHIAAGANLSSTTSNTAVTGVTSNVNHLPPYYALAYIMKT